MRSKLTRILSSFAMAGALTLTNVAVQAAEVVDYEYSCKCDIDESLEWDLEDYINSIKSIYKAEFPQQADIIDEVVDKISSDEDFIKNYENDGASAILYIEIALRNTFSSSISLTGLTTDKYTTLHSIPTIVNAQDSGITAAMMALYGSGTYDYSTTKNVEAMQSIIQKQFVADSDGLISIGEVTKVLNRNVPSDEGYSFQTMCFDGSNDAALDCFAISLEQNATPVIKVDDTATLSYYNGVSLPESHYVVVKSVDYNNEELALVDPDPGHSGDHTISFDEFKNISNESGKVFWASAYGVDRSSSGVDTMKAKYPNNTYYTNNGGACGCTLSSVCNNCKQYDGGWQCAAFSREFYHIVFGRTFTSSRSTNEVKVHKIINDADTMRDYLQGLPAGSYVRVGTTKTVYASEGGNGHSITVISTSNDGINLGQANYGTVRCKTSYVYYTWEDFLKKFPVLYAYAD